MSIAWLMIGDGRDVYHEQSLASMEECLPAPDRRIVVDDREHKLGFAGAVAEGWRQVVESGVDWVFHAEMDFTYNASIPVGRMIALLKRRPYLVQVALKRQPWNEQEHAAGGIVECAPADFTQVSEFGDTWTEHRKFFTTNPCVYSASLCEQGWPQEDQSEGKFGIRLFQDPEARAAFWGAKFDPPLVHHIGDTREGTGY